jgi:hypothetical protein
MKKISFSIITVIIFIVSLVPASAFANSGVLDQSNGPGTNSSQIHYSEPCGQEFVPTMPTLIGIEIYLYASVNANGDSTVMINIHPNSITETPIATQSYVIPSNSPRPAAWIYLEFANPVSLIPGNTYVLEVQSDTSYHMWYSTGDTYSDGNMIKKGDILSSQDWSFRTYGASPTKASSIEVDIDIKPGSDPNSINLLSKGVVPVALLTTIEFDATTVDPATVMFAGAMPVKWSTKDVDSDGDLDVVFHFRIRELDLDSSGTEATLTGDATNPTNPHIAGNDPVRIING